MKSGANPPEIPGAKAKVPAPGMAQDLSGAAAPAAGGQAPCSGGVCGDPITQIQNPDPRIDGADKTAGPGGPLNLDPSSTSTEDNPFAAYPDMELSVLQHPETRKMHEGALEYARAKRAKSDEKFRALVQEMGHFPNSTVMMAKRLGVDYRTIQKTAKRLAIDLPALRRAARDAAGGKELPLGKHENFGTPSNPATELTGSILQLFDTLMMNFRPEGEESADEETDPRTTWSAWRVFLAAAFGEPQEALDRDHRLLARDPGPVPAYPGVTADVPRGAAAPPPRSTWQAIFEACTGRTTWPKVQARLVSLIVGRRGGKSYITAIIGIYLALFRKYRLNLGTRGMVMILARDREQAGVIRGYVLAFLRVAPLNSFLAGDPTQKLIQLTNGITIEIRSVSEAGTRGYTVVAALMDEIAFWPTDTNSAKQDKKVLRALRPAMLGIPGAMIVMLSSPYAKRGELYEACRKFFGRDAEIRNFVWQADTLTMRPSDDPDFLDEIRTEYVEDPENAKAEYGAQFRADLEAIFARAAVEAVCMPGRVEMGYLAARAPYRIFVDPSGGSSDSYVAAVAHDETRGTGADAQVVTVVDKVVEWVPKFDPEEVSKEVVQLCESYHVRMVTGDAYAGEWPRDPLKKRGVHYELSAKTRSELYLEFVTRVNSKRVELPDQDHHRRLVNQLCNLERRVGRTGRDSVDHPSGSHDDVANAVAGVVVTPSTGGLFTGVVW